MLIKRIIGIGLWGAAATFMIAMNQIGSINIDHTLLAHFQLGAVPAPDYTEVLQEVTDLLDGNPNYTVEVVAHTGTRGTDDNNQTISDQRAKRVYDDLLDNDIDGTRISYSGVGESQPIERYDSETDALWQKRLARVEFLVEVK